MWIKACHPGGPSCPPSLSGERAVERPASSQRLASRSRLVPVVRYRAVGTAIDWLCSAFDFERLSIGTAVDGSVLRAELAFGEDTVLVLPVRAGEENPDDGRTERQCCY